MKIKNKAVRIFVVLIILVSLAGAFAAAALPKDYSRAQRICKRVLSRNREEMTAVARETLAGDLTASNYTSGQYKDYPYTMYAGREYVMFDIGSQGFLGGQYWSLAYCPNGTLFGENERYDSRETDGNNIYRAERVDDKWWFCWIDYDGTKLSDR